MTSDARKDAERYAQKQFDHIVNPAGYQQAVTAIAYALEQDRADRETPYEGAKRLNIESAEKVINDASGNVINSAWLKNVLERLFAITGDPIEAGLMNLKEKFQVDLVSCDGGDQWECCVTNDEGRGQWFYADTPGNAVKKAVEELEK